MLVVSDLVCAYDEVHIFSTWPGQPGRKSQTSLYDRVRDACEAALLLVRDGVEHARG